MIGGSDLVDELLTRSSRRRNIAANDDGEFSAGEIFRTAISLWPANPGRKDSRGPVRRKLQDVAGRGRRKFRNKKITRAIKSQPSRIVQPGGKSAGGAVRRELENYVTAGVRITLSGDEEIAELIKRESDRSSLDRAEGPWAGEDGRCAVGSKLVDDLVYTVPGVKITGTIKGRRKPLAGNRGECASCSVGREFEDGTGKIGIILILSHDKDVTCAVSRYTFDEKGRVEPGGKGALRAILSNFQNRSLKSVGIDIKRIDSDKKIARAVKGHTPRTIKPGGEGILRPSRSVLKD
jgi:hypothetical protein